MRWRLPGGWVGLCLALAGCDAGGGAAGLDAGAADVGRPDGAVDAAPQRPDAIADDAAQRPDAGAVDAAPQTPDTGLDDAALQRLDAGIDDAALQRLDTGAVDAALHRVDAGEPLDARPPADAAPPPDDAALPADAGAPALEGPALNPPLVPSAPTWRFTLRRGAGGLELARADYVPAVEGAAAPIADGVGDHVLVAWAGAEVVEAVPVRFPRAARREAIADDGRWAGADVEVPDAEAVAFLRVDPAVTRVSLLDAAGVEALARDAAALPGPPAGQPSVAPFTARFPHVEVVTALDRIAPSLRPDVAQVITPDAAQVQALIDGFERVTPLSLAAVRQVAVVEMPNGGETEINGMRGRIAGVTSGPFMILNVRFFGSGARLQSIIVHEAAHAFVHAVAPKPDVAAEWLAGWPAEVRAAIVARATPYVVEGDLDEFWRQLHNAAFDAGLAGGWLQDWPDDAAAVAAGFASLYGSLIPREDLAEYVAQASVSPDGPLCASLRAAPGGQIDADRALRWAKVRLVQALGLVSDRRVDRCVGAAHVEVGPGAHLHLADGQRVAFDDPDGRIVAATDNTLYRAPEGADCSGIWACGVFAPTPRTRELSVQWQPPYGPSGWRGLLDPAPAATPEENLARQLRFFQISMYFRPGTPLVGVHAITRRADPPVLLGDGTFAPFGKIMVQRQDRWPSATLSSRAGGFALVTQADATAVEGVVLFSSFELLVAEGDPRAGEVLRVPLTTFRVEEPATERAACCAP